MLQNANFSLSSILDLRACRLILIEAISEQILGESCNFAIDDEIYAGRGYTVLSCLKNGVFSPSRATFSHRRDRTFTCPQCTPGASIGYQELQSENSSSL